MAAGAIATALESNIAATMLVQAAFRLTGIPAKYADLMVRADQFVAAQGGVAGVAAAASAETRRILRRVLANCALADMSRGGRCRRCRSSGWLAQPLAARASGSGRSLCGADCDGGWAGEISQRPAAKSNHAVGAPWHAQTRRWPTWKSCRPRTKASLPSPLETAFVVMSLASVGCQEHPIVERGLSFCSRPCVPMRVGRLRRTWRQSTQRWRSKV